MGAEAHSEIIRQTIVPSRPNVYGMGSEVTSISTDGGSTCAVMNGAAHCWGVNTYGQLGNNSTTSSNVPVQVQGLGTGSGATAITGQTEDGCALFSSGTIQCWGVGAFGNLGNNSTLASVVPTQVQNITNGATQISGDYEGACAIVNGGARCWGSNYIGQLSNNSIAQQNLPVQVQGLTSGVTSVATGNGSACAVMNGAAYCWGSDQEGQLGVNGNYQSLVPVTTGPFQ
jgi:alpha-tubulin suppressor-like RCC1 family protein